MTWAGGGARVCHDDAVPSSDPDRQQFSLDDLRGRVLDRVHVVRGYLELHAEGAVLRCYAWPTLTSDGRTVLPGAADYRDVLGAGIGHRVVGTREDVSVVAVTLDNGTRIEVPLDAEFPWPEIAELVPPLALGAGMSVWGAPD